MKNFPINRATLKTYLVLISFVGILHLGTMVQADTIRVDKGRSPRGDVTKVTPDAVTITTQGGSEIEIPTNRIISISFSKEPTKLARARDAAFSDRLEDAIKTMTEVDTSDLTGPLAADAAFIPAMAEAQLALRGRLSIREAGSKLHQFIKDYPNSYHHYPANRLMGDLLVADGQSGAAVAYYKKLGKAPWPEYKAEAKILAASAMAEDGKTSEAQSLMRQAAASVALDPAQKASLELTKARCLMNESKTKQAIRLIEGQIKALPPENSGLNAWAYNLLGNAYRQAGQPRDAAIAFLHVDLLYANNAVAHAEAISNLTELWGEIHKPQRAQDATNTLKQRYPFSRWNK